MPLPTSGGSSRGRGPNTDLPVNKVKQKGDTIGPIDLPEGMSAPIQGPPAPPDLSALNGYELPLPSDVGLSYVTDLPDGVSKATRTGKGGKLQFAPVPTDPYLLTQRSASLVQKILNTGNADWYSVESIKGNLRALATMPQIAYATTPLELQGDGAEIAVRMLNQGGWQIEGGQVVRAAEDTYTIDQYTESLATPSDLISVWEESDKAAAQWLLDNPDIIEMMAGNYYLSVVGAQVTAPEGADYIATDDDELTRMMAEFKKMTGGKLPPELSQYLARHLAIMPDAQEMVRDAGISPSKAWWQDFGVGWQVLTKVPEAYRGVVNDPRAQLLSEAFLFVKNSDMDTLEEKGKFIDLVNMRTMGSIGEVESNKSGVGAFLNATVAVPFVTVSDLANDWLQYSANPNEFISAENLSIGQNTATYLGITPNDDAYTMVSGGVDGYLNFTPLDPIQALAGVGVGIRNAGKFIVPQGFNRVEAAKAAINPFTRGPFTNMPIFETGGPIAKMTFAGFANTVDDVVESRRFIKTATKVAELSSETRIKRLMPGWARSPKLLYHLAENADTVEEVQQIVKAAVLQPSLLGVDAPLLANKTADALPKAIDNVQTVRKNYLRERGSLADMTAFDQRQMILEYDPRMRPIQPRASLDIEFAQDVSQISRKELKEMLGSVENQSFADRITHYVGQGDQFTPIGDDLDASLVRRANEMRGDPAQALAADKTTLDTVMTRAKDMLKDKSGFTVSTETLRDGRSAAVYSRISEGGEKTTIFVVDGEIAGARIGNMAGTASDFEGNGIYTKILEIQRDTMQLTVDEMLEGTGSISRGAARAASRVFGVDMPVYKVGALNNSGSEKLAVSILGGGQKFVDLSDNLEDLADYLAAAGRVEDAAKIAMKKFKLSDLSIEGQRILSDYVESIGGTIGQFGDDVVVTNAGKKSLIEGLDIAASEKSLYDVMTDDYRKAAKAASDYLDFHTKQDPLLWLIDDPSMSLPTWTARVRSMTSNNSTSKFFRNARKMGASITRTRPGNIEMANTAVGAGQLETWMKVFGATDDLTVEWVDKFRRGNVGTRWEIIFDAFKSVGKESKNKMLAASLIDFIDKDGHKTFFYDRAGRELGLVNGKIRPTTLAHLSTEFVMPDSHELLRTLRRYDNAQGLPNWLVRGVGDESMTRKNRERIASGLRAKMRSLGSDMSDVTDSDLMKMAYANVLGGENGASTGYGMLARSVQRLVTKPFRAFHNIFTVSQLAGRPIAWSSRVLLEEQIRANMFGLPTVWNNPFEYAYQMWDSHGIRQLPSLLSDQATAVDGLVDELFVGGTTVEKLSEAIPNLSALLDKAGILSTDTERVRAFVAETVGNALTGVTENTLGSTLNITRSMARRERKITKLYENMAKDGMDKQFRWYLDGADIAQRSVWQSFQKETNAATVPLTWSTSGMSPRQIETFGYGYGRQIFQHIKDPIVGSYGLNRAIARAAGSESTWTGSRLIKSSRWSEIRHIVEEQAAGKGLGAMTETQLADWYLREYVDEIVSTLVDPLAKGSRQQRLSILKGFRNHGKVDIEMNGVKYTLNAAPENYDGFVNEMGKLAQGAYDEGVALPPKIAAFFDPRFGQRAQDGSISSRARRATDWVMERAGERPSQYLHRQPAFKHIHGKYYRYFRDLGLDEETARTVSSRKAAEMVNYIFFDNKNLPMFLKSMNQYIPFFSAMWEVGSTWAYKIPSVSTLGVGHLALARRVQRTLAGLQQTGLVTYDPESNQMTLSITKGADNATSWGAENMSNALYTGLQAPRVFLEHLAGLARMADIGNGVWDYAPADFSAWTKDGMQIGIGNPLDPTSSGLMAVNQFSIGADPIISLPVGIAAEAVFRLGDENQNTTGMSVGDWIEANGEDDFRKILNANEDKFREANNDEMFNRALSGNLEWSELNMPDSITIPQTSLWETLINKTFFPFGRYNGIGEVIWAATPSAINHVWMGIFQQIEEHTDLNATELIGFFMGETAQSSFSSEVLSQIQMREAATGDVSKILALQSEAERLISQADFQLSVNDETGFRTIMDPDKDQSAANQIQNIWDEVASLTESVIRDANNNAGASAIMRGVYGSLLPSTPRMWDRQQQQVATYWAARDMAETAKESGHLDWSKGITDAKIQTPEDMARLTNLVNTWLTDDTGDAAKSWLLQNYPEMLIYTQGKSYWGASGPPVYAEGFDEWNQQQQSGDRKTFDPEVYIARYWRAGIATDREAQIRNTYGTDPAEAAQAILFDPEGYRALVEDYDANYDAIEFIDAHLFEGRYAAHRETSLENLSVYEELEQRRRDSRDEADRIQQVIEYGNLPPADKRKLGGYLASVQAEENRILGEIKQFEDSNSIYRNNRERLLDNYYSEFKNPYRKKYSEVLDGLDTAETQAEVSLVWEEARQLANEAANKPYFLKDDITGKTFQVPSPEEHSWNGMSQKERQEGILSMVARKPEWLSAFEMRVLVNESPEAAQYLPITAEQRQLYDDATKLKQQIREEYLADPTAKHSQYEAKLQEVDDRVDEILEEDGREAEKVYRNAVPLQQLDMLGLTPPSLRGVIPVLNQVIAELRSVGKGETSNAGYEAFRQIKVWLVSDYFNEYPTAKNDLIALAWSMYGTRTLSTVFARMLQGDRFGELE